MFDEQDRKYFYDEFKNNGYQVGSYDDFKKDLNNKEDRDWYYNEAKNMGYDVGTQADFDKMVLEAAPSSPAPSASPSPQNTKQEQLVPKTEAKQAQKPSATIAKPQEQPSSVNESPSLISQALGMIPNVDAGNIGKEQRMGSMLNNFSLGGSEEQPQQQGEKAPQQAQVQEATTSPTGTASASPSIVNNEGLLDAKLSNYIENWKQRPDQENGYFQNMVADLLADGTANTNEEAVNIVKSALGRYANRQAMDATSKVVSALPDDTVQDAERNIEAQWYSHGVQDKLKQEAQSMGISYDDYVAQFLKPAMVQNLVQKYGQNYRNMAEDIATRLYSHDEHVQDRLMNQDINDALASVIGKYVSPSVVDEYNKAQEAGGKAFSEGMEGSQYVPANLRLGTAIASQYEANQAKDPKKVLNTLQKKFGKLYQNQQFLNDIADAASGVMQQYNMQGGLSGDPKQFQPMINAALKNELDQLEVKGMMPKGSAEYIMKTGLGNTIVGKITRKAMQTDYQNWLEDIANQQYQPGFWENVASGALTFAGDAWSYWLPGAVGSKITKSMLAKAEGRLATDLWAKGMERKMAERAAKVLIGKSKGMALKSGAAHGAATFGGQSAISKPIDEAYHTGQFDEDGKIYKPSVGKILANALGEVAKQSAVGAIMQGGTVANMIGKGRGLATNILADVGGKVVDSSIMTGQQMLERMAHDPNFKPTGKDAAESFLESMANLTAIGLPGMMGKYARFKDAREFNRKYDFNEQDIAELKKHGYDGLRDAFEKVGIYNKVNKASDVHVEESPNPQSHGWNTDLAENIGIKKLGEPKNVDRPIIEAPEVKALTNEYMDLLSDKSVPEVLKAKMMAVVEGKRPSSFSPMIDTNIEEADDGKVYLETLNKDGGVIERLEYSSLDEAQKAEKKLEYEKTLGLASVLEGEYHKEYLDDHLFDLYNQAAQKYYMGEKLSDEEKAAVYLRQNAVEIGDIMRKRLSGTSLTAEEQKQVEAYQHFYSSAMENSSVMRDFVSTFEDSNDVPRGTLRRALESKDKKYASLVESYLKELYNSIKLKREMRQTAEELHKTSEGEKNNEVEGKDASTEVTPSEEVTETPAEKPASSPTSSDVPPTEPPTPPVGGGASSDAEGTPAEGSGASNEPKVASNGTNVATSGSNVASSEPNVATSDAYVMGQNAYKNGDAEGLKAIDHNFDVAELRLQRAFNGDEKMISLIYRAIEEGRDMETFVQQRAGHLTPAQKDAIRKYAEAMDAKKGVMEAVDHADDGYGEALTEQLWPYATEDGSIVPVTLQDGKTAFLKKANEYGGAFVATTDENGKPVVRLSSSAQIKEKGEPVPFQDYVNQLAAQKHEETLQSFNTMLDGSGFKRGDIVSVSMEEGLKPSEVKVVGYTGDGRIVLTDTDVDINSKIDPDDLEYLSKDEFDAMRTNALRNTINAELDAEDAQRANEETAKAEAEKQERYKKGIWGYTTGQPDYADPQTDPKVAAEYLQETSGADRKDLFSNIAAEKQSLQTRIKQLREHIANNEEWLSLNADLDPKNAETRTLANKQMQGQITDLQTRFDNWNKIRSAVMTPEEAAAIKKDRTQKIADAGVNEGDIVPIEGREVAVLSDEELKKQYPTMDEASDYITSERKRIYQIQSDEVQNEIDGVDKVLKQYTDGEIDLEPEQIRELNTTKAQLQARQQNLTESAKDLKTQADKLKKLYLKENKVARAKAIGDMTPAGQRAVKVANAIEGGNLSLLNSIYEEVRGATDFNSTEPDTLEEYVASNIGRFSLNYEGKEKNGVLSNGLQQETGLGRKDFNKLQILAKAGEGKTVAEFVHGLYNGMPEHLRAMGYNDTSIRNAFLELVRSAESYSDLKNYTLNNKVYDAEQKMQELERQKAEMMEAEDEGAVDQQGNGKKFAERLQNAIAETETEPTEAQKKAGNYKKGHLQFGGYDYTVETPKGATRSGVDEQGNPWSVTMHDTYGYIKGKIGVDGDHIDMFVNDDADLDTFDGNVFVVDQVNPETGEFDEHKVMYGYPSQEAATEAYLANYSKGWKGIGKVTSVPKATFDKWLESSDRKTKPFADYAMIQKAKAQKVSYNPDTHEWTGIPEEVITDDKPNRYGVIDGFTKNPRIYAYYDTKSRTTWLRVETIDNQAETPERINTVLEKEGYQVHTNGESSGYVDFDNYADAEKFAKHVDDVEKYVHSPKDNQGNPINEDGSLKLGSINSVDGIPFEQIKPIGTGAFGNIYNQFKGKPDEAVAFLMQQQGGEALGALYHDAVGDVDLVWGKTGTKHSDGFGLAKLVKYHPEVVANLQGILSSMKVDKRSPNRVNLSSDKYKAGIRLDYDGKSKTWLLTAYEKEVPSDSSKTTDTATSSLSGDTALTQSEGISSAGKGTNNSDNSQEKGQENAGNLPFGAQMNMEDLPFSRDVKEVKPSEMTESQKVAYDAVSTMLKKAGVPVKVISNEDMEKVAEAQDNIVLSRLMNDPRLRFYIKTPEQKKAANSAYDWASQNRPDKHKQYAIVNMDKPNEMPEYFEKKDLAERARKYYSNEWKVGNYKAFDLDKPFEEQVKDVKGNVPDEFDPYKAAKEHANKLADLKNQQENLVKQRDDLQKQYNDYEYKRNKTFFDALMDYRIAHPGEKVPDSFIKEATEKSIGKNDPRQELNRQMAEMNAKIAEISKQLIANGEKISFLKGKGTVYGYTDGKEIVLNQEHLNPNTPIHEYQHLWRTAAKAKNPDLIAHGDKLIMQTSLFVDLKKDPNYKHLSNEQLCDEAFSQLTGEDGAKILEDMAKEAIKENPLDTAKELSVINKLKDWLKKFWYWTLDTFTKWKPEDIRKMTLEDIRNLVLRDLAKGVDPRAKLNESAAKETRELKKANDAFNQRLDELAKNPNQKDKVLRLGRSSTFLKDGGIADADIELDYDKLMRKSKQGYVHEHPFDVADVNDLPLAVAYPISVFDNTNGKNGGQVILTELKKEDRNFIVAVRTESQNRKGGVVLKVNKIVTLFPKDAKGVINWFNQGKATNIDKEKALHFIEALQNHPGTTITSEELNSAANVINSFETAKENGEKISLKDDKTLVGVHNITEEKLRKALKLGGFANPSVAVIDTGKSAHNSFGEISFIAPSALVDKRTGGTAGTWTTDAYTQRYPSVERQMSDKGYENFKKWVDGLDYPDSAKMEIERQAKDALEDNRDPAWELMYLKEKGIDIKGYDSKVNYLWQDIIEEHPSVEDILESMKSDPKLNEDVTKLAKSEITAPTWRNISQEVSAQMSEELGRRVSTISPKVRAKTKEIFERDYAPSLFNKDGSPKKADVKKVVAKMVQQYEDTKQYSFYKSKVRASSYVHNNGLYADYIRWQENKLDEFGTKNRLFRGFKNDGTRKYVPETLENVSKAMRDDADGQTNGSEYTTFGSFIAKLADRVDSTDEMRANKDKLSSNEDKQDFYEKWEEVYYDLAKFLYNDVAAGEQRLHDIVTKSDPKRYAKKEYGITLTPAFMKKLDALKKAVREELKSNYFETKFERPVHLDEFAAAVVPKDLGADVRKGLEQSGLRLYDYDAKKEGDRQRAFDKAIHGGDNIRFMFAGERGAANADEAEEKTYRMDNLKVAEEMERGDKDAKAIKLATGWERGADGKWRYEMPDAKIKDTIDIGGGHIVKRYEEDMLWTDGKLGKVVDAPELFKAYPQLKDIKLSTDVIMNDMPSNGAYDHNTKTITIHADELKYLNSILNHEIQHAIQDIEGFAQGGSQRQAATAAFQQKLKEDYIEAIDRLDEVCKKNGISRLAALDEDFDASDNTELKDAISSFRAAQKKILASPYDRYLSLAGEVEARNVQKRLGMTDEQRRNTLASETEDVNRDEQIVMNGDGASYSIVEDPKTIEKLDKEETVKVYRAMQLGEDGKLYPPMAAKVKGKFVQPIELGKWEQADERPDLADKNGLFTLNKGNGKTLKATYNPYLHTSRTPLNDQFSEAQSRPNIVTVEVEVPKSELTSGYRAEKAKDAVGEVEWKAGIIQGQLTGKRKVILSRWDKPVRIVPDSEVADVIVNDMFKDKKVVMPTNVVTPSLRKELEKRGVPFVETDNRGRIVGGKNDGVHYSKVYGKKATSKLALNENPDTIGAKELRIQKLRDSEPIRISGTEIPSSEDLKQYKKNALEYGKTLQGTYTNKDDGTTIQLQRGRKNGGVREVLQHNYKDIPHLQSVAAIPQIIENSIYIDSRENQDRAKNPDVSEYRYYVCGLKIGKEDYTVRSVVAVDKNDNRYYDHKLTDIEKGKLLDYLNQEALYNVGFGTTPSTKLTTDIFIGKDTVLKSILQTNKQEIAKNVQNTVNRLGGAEANVYTSLDDVPEEYLSEVEQGAKGWYDPATHTVHVYLPNCADANDAQRTVFHEKIGHEGMEVLLGGESGVRKFANFVYKSVGKKLRGKILDFANKYDPDWKNPDRMNVGTQEYIAHLAEEGPLTAEDFSLWTKIKHYLIKALKKLGIRVPGLLNDKDLRYYLMKAGKALHVWDNMPKEKQEAMMAQASNAEIKDALKDGAGKGKPRQKKGESAIQYMKRVMEWKRWKEAREDENDPEPPQFYDFDKDVEGKKEWEQLNKDWRSRHGISEELYAAIHNRDTNLVDAVPYIVEVPKRLVEVADEINGTDYFRKHNLAVSSKDLEAVLPLIDELRNGNEDVKIGDDGRVVDKDSVASQIARRINSMHLLDADYVPLKSSDILQEQVHSLIEKDVFPTGKNKETINKSRLPMREEGETDDDYAKRIKEYEKWNAAVNDKDDPMPDMFSFEKERQKAASKKYEDWLARHELLEQEQADLDLYEGKIYPAETNPEADALEQRVMQDLAEVTSTDVSKEGAARTVKHAVIHRRKNMEEASADDAIYINDVKNRIEKMADSGVFDKLLADYQGKPNKAEKLAEAIPYIIEAPRRLRDIAHDLNNTGAFDKGHIHIQPSDVEAIQPFVSDLASETYKKHIEIKNGEEVEVYDNPQAVSELASKMAQAINANHQGEEGFVPIDGTDILSEHVLPLVRQKVVPVGIDYQNITPEMQATLDSIRDWYNYTYDWLKDNHTLREDTGFNADYVNHIWDKEKSDKQAYAMYVENRQRTKSPNEKPRTISTLMEGISVGLVPKTTDITKMMAYYSRSNIEAWVNKTMLQELSGLNVIERNEEGEIVSSDPLLSSVAPINLEQYRYFEIPGVGPVWVYNVSPKEVKVKNPITDKEKTLYREASAGDRFGVVFDTYQSSPFWKAFDTLASSAKKLELGFSGFHAGALTEVYMVQNAIEFGPKKALAYFMKYIFGDTAKNHELPCFANPEDFQEAASHLVKFGATNDYAAADVQNMFDNFRDSMMKIQEKLGNGNVLSKAGATASIPFKVASQMLSLVNKGMDRALWDFLHDGLKLATYRMRAEKTKERAKKYGWTAEQLSKALDEDGQFVNDMFGGQHWDVLGASQKRIKKAGRWLLSPDWNASTTRHFLALTGYGSVWNEATMENFRDYYKRLWGAARGKGELKPEDWGRTTRQLSSLLCYGLGFMVFYEAFANGVNAAFRAMDEEKEREKAEEIRKTNPDYKSPYELAYPDGMKWYDYLMRGNTLGQQSKIFVGRYADGTEMYIRHGKQFREIPEYFFNEKGEFEFPGPMVQRMIGKANPIVRMIHDDINYLSDFQASHADQELQRKYAKLVGNEPLGKGIGLLHKNALYWAPFLIPSQENKEFKAADFFFPSSKGFSPWKAQSYFKDFILSGDMEGVMMTYNSCERNGIDPEAQIAAAITSVKALESAEMKDGVTSLQIASERFDEAKSITEKKKMRQKMKKFLSQSEYKVFTQKEALDMVQSYLNGEDDLEELQKAENKYLMKAKSEDVTEDWRIQSVWNGTMDTYQEYQRLKDEDKVKANAFKNNKTNKRLFEARKAISAAKKKMNKAKKEMDGKNDAAKLVEIRTTRKKLLETLNGME